MKEKNHQYFSFFRRFLISTGIPEHMLKDREEQEEQIKSKFETSKDSVSVFHIDKVEPWQYGNEFRGCMFELLVVRMNSVVVKSNADEGHQPPYEFHEFPKEIGTIIIAKRFP